MKWILAVIATVMLSSEEVNAQQKEDMNLKGEHRRTRQGIKSGEITRGEAAKIKEEAKDVRDAKKSAKADGIVTGQERREIAKQDRQLDKTIHRTKHNNRRRR